MKPASLFLIIFFWAALIFDCALIISGAEEYRYFTKLLLMPLLFGLMVSEIDATEKWWSVRIMSLALVFSLIGDALLINPDATVAQFMLGIAAFWIVQVCYIFFFYRKRPFRKKDAGFLFFATLAILAYLIFLHYLMWAKLDKAHLQIPVIIYSLTIGFMLICAFNINNSRSLNNIGVLYFIPGAILFVISDSLIALNKFYFVKPMSGVAIMATYGIAQFLIVTGAIKFIKK